MVIFFPAISGLFSLVWGKEATTIREAIFNFRIYKK